MFYYNPPLFAHILQDLKTQLAFFEGGDNKAQEAKLIALYQFTRFGKTKLCFSLGFERFVVVLRLKELEFNFQQYINNSIDIIQAVKYPPTLEDQDLVGGLVIRNHMLLFLWVLSYVELLRLLFNNGTYSFFLLFLFFFCISPDLFFL